MRLYYIYHIPGIKVGCTQYPGNRPKKQGYNEYQLLEVHEDIHIASERERIIQKQLGYLVDKTPYWEFMEYAKKARKIGGKIVGSKNVESGHLQSISSEGGKAHKGKTWINNGIVETFIFPDRLEEYYAQGYCKGRLKRK